MRLKECYIEGFGKLSAKKITFSPGLNSFVYENGYGKTTLTAFIRAMLFGLSDSKKADLDENERKHYLPWGGGVCGGWLTFEVMGNVYRVARTFGQKPSQDTFELYDEKTGNVSDRYTENLGRELFKIDKDGFMRTVFLSDRNLSGKNTNKTISEKLSDLSGVDGDVGVMDDALKLLDERRKFYYKKGGDGEIAYADAELKQAEYALEELDRKRGELRLLEAELDEQERRYGELHSEERSRIEYEKKLSEVNRKAVLAEHYKKRLEEAEGKEARLTELNAFFGENIPSTHELDRMSFELMRERDIVATEPPKKSARLLEIEAMLSDKAVAERTTEEVVTEGGRSLRIPLLLGVLLILASVPLFFINTVLGALTAGIGAILTIAMLVIKSSAKEAVSLPKEDGSGLALIAEYNALSADYERAVASHMAETEKAREKINEINASLSVYPTVSEYKLEEIRAALKEREDILGELNTLKAESERYTNDNGPADLSGEPKRTLEEISRDIALLGEEIKRKRAAEKELELALEYEDARTAERDAAKDKLGRYKQNYETILRTKEFLEKAKDNMVSRYLGKTKDSFRKYLELFATEGDGFDINTDFEVKKYEIGAMRSAEAYSTGTRDLYYLAIRLALIDSLYENEAPFLIFDDPLTSFDDKKSEAVKNVIRALSSERQILYFTCSSSRGV